MFDVNGPELLILSVLGLIPVLIGYWSIRLAVRDGVVDAHQRVPGPHSPMDPPP